MPQKRFIWLLSVFLIFVIAVEVLLLVKVPQNPLSKIANSNPQIFSEKIPGSKFHGPDATWWGYNQSKIVRFKDTVFMYVIENKDDKNTTLSDFVIYKKEGQKSWERGASLPTSRPGNILADSSGVLHAFVFEPTNVAINDSIGKLVHYWLPEAFKGNITNFEEEIVVRAQAGVETVNIRVGAAIGKDDTMAIGFGLTKFNPLYTGYSEHLYYKKPSDVSWKHSIAGENLGHDWFYPFVFVDGKTFYLLPVQDDFADDDNPATYDNIYQKIMYLENSSGVWKKEIIVDHSKSTIAKTRSRIVEQDDLFVDSKGTIHVVYKENTDPQNRFLTNHIHLSKKKGDKQFTREKLNLPTSINWVRLFEVDGTVYFFANSWDKHYLARLDSQNLVQLPISDSVGAYPYVTRTNTNSMFVDIMLITADNETFKKGTNVNYYIRIPKTELTKIK